MLFVVPMKETELLFAVGGVIGGVHIQDNGLPGAGMGLEVKVQQPVERRQRSLRSPGFQTWTAWLGGQSAPLSGALPAMILRAGSLASQAASLLSS